MSLRTRLSPPGQMHLSRTALVVVAGGLLLGMGVLALAQRAIPSVSSLLARSTPEPVRKVQLPEVLKASARPYAAPPPPPPVAQPLPRSPVVAPAPLVASLAPTPPVAPAPPVRDTLPGFLQTWEQQERRRELVPPTPPPPPGQPKEPAQPKPRQAWRIRPTDITLKKEGEAKGPASKTEQEQVARQGQADQLVKPAIWARPRQVRTTLYASQVLPCITETAIESSIPGRVIMRSTVPIFDKVYREYELVPKDALIVAAQETQQVKFGQYRLALAIKQFEFPDGTIWAVKSNVGDGEGKQGLTGDVDNHWLQLGAATLINAVLGIGVNSLAGTPSSFYANPAQQATRDATQSLTEDVRSITKEQLKVPPSITIPRGTVCTVFLEDNISFAKKPYSAR
jgi:type IV secretion system protein VirB10